MDEYQKLGIHFVLRVWVFVFTGMTLTARLLRQPRIFVSLLNKEKIIIASILICLRSNIFSCISLLLRLDTGKNLIFFLNFDIAEWYKSCIVLIINIVNANCYT